MDAADAKTSSKRRKITKLKAHSHSIKGRRGYQEDRYVCKILDIGTNKHFSQGSEIEICAVFDGHGGSGCSEFTSLRLPESLKHALQKGLHPVQALVQAHLATEASFLLERDSDDGSGTTAVVALVDKTASRLWVSNCGDSRALLLHWKGRDKKQMGAKALTKDHDANNKSEARRVKVAKGTVDEDGYINDCVQVSRSIGDFRAKFVEGEDGMVHSAAVSPIPDVLEYSLCEDDTFLVVGCDGLFEGSDGDMAWIAQETQQGISEEKSAAGLCRALVSTAFKQGSTDNITCSMLPLNR